MKDFSIEREKIKELFKGRPGFTDEVIDAITATYVYLDDKYEEKISVEEIQDAKKFKGVTTPRSEYTIAEIYLNRVFNNVKEVVADHGSAGPNSSQFDQYTLKVFVLPENHPSWEERLKSTPGYNTMTEEEKDFRMKQIRAKVITHELIHAGSFDGETIGFISTSFFSQEKRDSKHGKGFAVNYSIACSGLFEELLTEELALDIVGMNRRFLEVRNLSDTDELECIVYSSRNPESSNYFINCLGAYLTRSIPGIVRGKFVRPMDFLMQFNKNSSYVEEFEDEIDVKTNGLSGAIVDVMEGINEKKLSGDKSIQTSIKNAMVLFQEDFLTIYMKNLKIESPQEYLNAVQTRKQFIESAVRLGDGTIIEPLKTKLDELFAILKEYSIKFSKEEKEYLKKIDLIDREEDVPYAHIIKKEQLETEQLLSK